MRVRCSCSISGVAKMEGCNSTTASTMWEATIRRRRFIQILILICHLSPAPTSDTQFATPVYILSVVLICDRPKWHMCDVGWLQSWVRQWEIPGPAKSLPDALLWRTHPLVGIKWPVFDWIREEAAQTPEEAYGQDKQPLPARRVHQTGICLTLQDSILCDGNPCNSLDRQQRNTSSIIHEVHKENTRLFINLL